MTTLNKAQLIGYLGADPIIRTMQDGKKVASVSLATTDRWKDKTGKPKERTEWHRVIVFDQGAVTLAEKYMTKGMRVMVEGTLQTRKFKDKDGVEKSMTEIVVHPYRGSIKFMDPKTNKENDDDGYDAHQGDLDDEVPF
jgi:single-strand DNA-binding protein